MARECHITTEQLLEALPVGEWIRSKNDNPVAPSLISRVGGKLRHARHIDSLLDELELAGRVELFTVEAGARNSRSDTVTTGVMRLL
jgi:hypothetical protein